VAAKGQSDLGLADLHKEDRKDEEEYGDEEEEEEKQ